MFFFVFLLKTLSNRTLNSSCHAPPNYNVGLVSKGGEYRYPYWPKKRARTLLIYHNGHETNNPQTNFDGVVWHFNALGFDVAEFDMPLIGFNHDGIHSNHQYFEQWEKKGLNLDLVKVMF
jgi:hypothetical protein